MTSAQSVWLRQDWLDELGIELDKDGNRSITLDELKETAIAFQENDLANTGKGLVCHWPSGCLRQIMAARHTGTAIMNAFEPTQNRISKMRMDRCSMAPIRQK